MDRFSCQVASPCPNAQIHNGKLSNGYYTLLSYGLLLNNKEIYIVVAFAQYRVSQCFILLKCII